MTDPKLFNFRRMVVSRDHKIFAAASLFIGGLLGRALLGSAGLGTVGALAVGAGFRLLAALWWLYIPGKKGDLLQ